MAASMELRIAKCQVPSGNTARTQLRACVCVCVRCGVVLPQLLLSALWGIGVLYGTAIAEKALYRVPIASVVASVNASCWQVINSFYCSHIYIHTLIHTLTKERCVSAWEPERLSNSAHLVYSPMKLMTWLPCQPFGSNLFFLLPTFGLCIFRHQLSETPVSLRRCRNCPFPFEIAVDFCLLFYICCSSCCCVICSSINLKSLRKLNLSDIRFTCVTNRFVIVDN